MDTADGQAVQGLFRLPVSGHLVVLRHPTGAEDLLLLEASGDETELALALADQLAQPTSGATFDWRELTVSDLEALILRLRQAVIGDRVRADVACQSAGCGRRIDISFSVNDYLAHRKPAKPGAHTRWSVEPDEELGWFRLTPVRKRTGKLASRAEPPADDSGAPAELSDSTGVVVFRLPTVADQLAVAACPDAAEELARRCIRPAGNSVAAAAVGGGGYGDDGSQLFWQPSGHMSRMRGQGRCLFRRLPILPAGTAGPGGIHLSGH